MHHGHSSGPGQFTISNVIIAADGNLSNLTFAQVSYISNYYCYEHHCKWTCDNLYLGRTRYVLDPAYVTLAYKPSIYVNVVFSQPAQFKCRSMHHLEGGTLTGQGSFRQGFSMIGCKMKVLHPLTAVQLHMLKVNGNNVQALEKTDTQSMIIRC